MRQAAPLLILQAVTVTWMFLNITHTAAVPRGSLRGATAFVRDFVDYHNFKLINIYTTFKERNWLTRFFFLGAGVRVVRVNHLSFLYNRSDLEQNKQLSVVMATSDHLGLFSKMMVPKKNVWWLVLVDYQEKLDILPLPLNNQVILVEALDSSKVRLGLNSSWDHQRISRLHLREAYTTAPHLSHRVTTVGYWVEGEGDAAVALKAPSLDVYNRRGDLLGIHLRCITAEWVPTTINGPIAADGSLHVLGWFGRIWDSMEKLLNFTSTCRLAPDGEWGTLRDGRWTGMVGEVVQDLADVAVAPIDNTLLRSFVIRYTVQISNSRYTLAVRKKKAVSWESYTMGFGIWCWVVVLGFMVLLPIILVKTASTSPIECTNSLSVADAATLVFGSFVQQGSWISFSSFSNRIIFLTSFLTGVLLYAFYTSALFTSLAFSRRFLPFSTLEELLVDGSYRFGFIKGISMENVFRNPEHKMFWRIWQELVLPDSLVTEDAQGLVRAREENYVHMIDLSVFNYLNKGHCELVSLPIHDFSFPSGFAFQLGSPFVEVFSRAIINLSSVGLLKKYQKISMSSAVTDTSCDISELEPVSLTHVCTSFLLLILGIIVSLLMLLVERRDRGNRTLGNFNNFGTSAYTHHENEFTFDKCCLL